MSQPHSEAGTPEGGRDASGTTERSEASAGKALLSPAQVLTILLRYRRPLIVVPIVLFVITVLLTITGTRTYTSTVSFTPVSSLASVGQLSGIAAQFGVALPGQNPEDSPLFYGNLVRTNNFLKELALTQFTFADAGSSRTGNLIEIYEIEKSTPELSLFEAIRMLRDEKVSVSPDRQTGIVTLRVTADWPDLADAMARRALELVNAHNQGSRQGNATATRDFLTTRLDSAEIALRSVEDDLERFLRRNRDFRSDPTLSFEHERLNREVGLRRDVYSTLVQAREQARIEAVRNTPSITLVEPPSPPLRPDRRFLILRGLVALMFGTVIALGYVFAREFARNNSADSREAEDLRTEWRESLNDLARLRPHRKHDA